MIDELGKAKTIAELERITGASKNIIAKLEANAQMPKHRLPHNLCIDEVKAFPKRIAIRRGEPHMASCIYDADEKTLVDMLAGDDPKTVTAYLESFTKGERDAVATISCDLNGFYISLAEKFFPGAVIYADKTVCPERQDLGDHRPGRKGPPAQTGCDNEIPVSECGAQERAAEEKEDPLMTKYAVESEYCSVFGMDVHARTTTIKGLDRSTGETRMKRFNDAPAPAAIASWMKQNFAGPWYAAYESGCTGFHLCRELRREGIGCDVVAVSSIARSADDKQRKNDSRDATRLLSELVSMEKTYTAVWTPDPETEAMRDLCRARVAAVDAVKVAKLQTSAILLRHGYVWNEKTPDGTLKNSWTKNFVAWIKSADLGDACANEALAFSLRAVEEGAERVKDLEAKLDTLCDLPRWKPYVDAISLLRGVGKLTALTLACEIGSFHRFRSGRDVSKWLGTVPSHSESGGKGHHGGITKAGNAVCRTLLVEGITGSGRYKYKSSKALRAGQVVSPDVKAVCRKADRRLAKRRQHLSEQKKHPNKIKIAIANELIRWVWVIGCMVEDEQTVRIISRPA
ncbi:IS110 family transposase [Adlercreutzia sp. ZJ138]|uniref:IS110 family transposase n=1 Tax=Adlercreutzia sp. ZJ138 TaxID=2709405 RepID=UPI0013EBC925|nr:IS110 family transposase [Adlercreutzia sp. ZJ138]